MRFHVCSMYLYDAMCLKRHHLPRQRGTDVAKTRHANSLASASVLSQVADDITYCLQSFEGREQRDSASAVPDGYEPPNFQTLALQHTNVQLTWDADDDGRKRALSAKRATQADIREDDFKVTPAKQIWLVARS